MKSTTPFRASAIRQLIKRAMSAASVPGVAVAVIENRRLVFAEGFGTRRSGKNEPVTPDTLFAVGSTTKAMTTAAIAMLVDEGKMAWNDPIHKYVEYFRLHDPLASAQTTIRDLLCHRTGVGRHDQLWYRTNLSREELVRKIAHVEQSSSFRSTFLYNNIMYVAAALALEKAAGCSWEAFIQKRIFDPIGMSGATPNMALALQCCDRAFPHRLSGSHPKVLPFYDLDNTGPAGSVQASVNDMARWVRFQLGDGTWKRKRLVSEANMREMHTPQMVMPVDEDLRRLNPNTQFMSYGLGWFVHDYHGRLVISHGGGTVGFVSQVQMIPSEGIGVACLINCDFYMMSYAICCSILDILLDAPRRDWVRVHQQEDSRVRSERQKRQREQARKRHKHTRPSRELSAYAGQYQNAAYGAVRVLCKNRSLSVERAGVSIALKHWHYDIFYPQTDSFPFQHQLAGFILDGNGTPIELWFIGVKFTRI